MSDRLTLERLMEMGDEAHVNMAVHGKNALTGDHVDRLPPRLWEALRIKLQDCYRRATGEEFSVLKIEGDGHE